MKDKAVDEDTFVNYVHDVARRIAEQARRGMPHVQQVIAAADAEAVRYCERYLSEYDYEYPQAREPRIRADEPLLRAIARLMVVAMIRQHEVDAGEAQTLAESWASWASESK